MSKVEWYVGRVPYRLAVGAPWFEVTQERGCVTVRISKWMIQVDGLRRVVQEENGNVYDSSRRRGGGS